MNNTHQYTDATLPLNLKIQILDFLRIVWSDGFTGDNLYRDWIDHPHHQPQHFVISTENDLLVSYVAVVSTKLTHQDVKYQTYGLSGLFTYPQFRGHKYGLDLVKQAINYIKTETNADIILFPSCLGGFYEQAGFEHITDAQLFEGPPEKPVAVKDKLFMQFISNQAQKHSQDFFTKPIYFGEDIW